MPDALSEVDASVDAGILPPNAELVIRTLLGDIEGAMRVVEKLRDYGEPFEMDLLFIPEMQRVRSHDGFEGLMKDIGLRSYWTSNGCEWNGSSMVCSSS